MKKAHEIGTNSSLVSIREGDSPNVLPNTNEDEKHHVPIINFEVLRSLERIIRGIKARINAGEQQKSGKGGAN